jgi:hypothetical protein
LKEKQIMDEHAAYEAQLEQFDAVCEQHRARRIRGMARMHYKDRAKRGTPAERKEAAKLRASALTTSKAAAHYGMSVAEFNKAILYCDFHKRIRVYGRIVNARFWFPDSIHR